LIQPIDNASMSMQAMTVTFALPCRRAIRSLAPQARFSSSKRAVSASRKNSNP